ncbi:MAG TPA: amidohydrolase family protein [Bryobacteraceae bacterium]|nr:amidohydrolase family protein [Bryobacteraceae bacterium]
MRCFHAFVWFLAAGSAFGQSLAITGATVYPSSSSAPLRRTTVLIRGSRIEAVGEQVPVPAGVDVIRCASCVVVAGFWNSHVHFTEPKWEGAASQPAKILARQITEMLTHSGFTTVIDTGSVLSNTVALRRRIETGEIPGPRILTAGMPIFPPNGVPYYVKDSVSPETLKALTPPANAGEAVAAVDADIRGGADLVKLFTGSWISREKVLPMPQAIASAAVRAAHKRGKLVFTHPSDLDGVRIAIAAGVDVFAHAPEQTRGVDGAILKSAVNQHMAMIPTLKLFGEDNNIADIRRVVRQFDQMGGLLVFGTDTGYLTDYDVSQEYEQLAQAGLSWRDTLAMLTENPARLFGDQTNRGRVKSGMAGDLTILEADPATDPSAFRRVRYTIRNGKVIWASR